MARLTVDIVTAERVTFSEEGVEKVIAPGTVGEFTVLPEHAAFITTLVPGEMRIVRGGEETSIALTGGFLEVRNDRVVVLADAAERAEEIDAARAEAARRRATERLAERGTSEDMARSQAALQRALLRLRVAERRRRRPGGPSTP
ncbi:MAG TPA: F0F1 ATP synthase subunit epsilon [Dehalococcoidia bacterium]|nr:F0F1 ATP synthase subunit epsilon [Dehalococcoidia bacterium]HLB29884.1 F0F1 ATP synthase subunit epsilon [Dehalococcoidia bacterium]